MKKRLTKKEKGFARDYVLTENGTQAALSNYDVKDAKVAAVIAYENLNKPHIQDEIENVKIRLADRIPDALLEKKILEGLDAEQHRFSPEGELLSLPDYATRHKYVDTSIKLKGDYAPDKSVNLNLDATSSETTRDLGNRLVRLFRRGN